ncbi:MAG: DUF1801 domain-containing protein [Williamsia sp.]|nr:DUF1801 domain-containing protein [Williamsia sp.]
MAKNKTVETQDSVQAYLDLIADEKKQHDCAEIVALISQHTGLEPKMWGSAIIGFGSYHYKYASGREGDAPLAGLSARINAITLYLADDPVQKEAMLKRLGKHKAGKSCVYIQKLEDINKDVLIEMASNSVSYLKKQYPST